MPDLRNIDAFADVTGPQPDHTHDSGELPRSTAGVSPEEAGGEYRCSECHAALLYPHDPLCSKRRLTIDAVLHKDVETVASIQREADANRARGYQGGEALDLRPGVLHSTMLLETGVNPKDLIGAKKSPVSLIPAGALAQVAPAFALGARKYGAFNWRTPGQPVQHMTYCEAALRHIYAYIDGQTIDPESGSNHLAHAVAGLLILLDAQSVGNSIDNRPTPGVAAEIMALVGVDKGQA